LVVHGDAFVWLASHPASPNTSLITSLPDVSELSSLGFEGWKRWFVSTARVLIEWLPREAVAVFYQSDVRRGAVWVDKGYLVQRAAEDAGAQQLFHRIVCRRPVGTRTLGRASYAHLLAFTRSPLRAPHWLAPDVLPDAGRMTWSRAMGVEACRLACGYLKAETSTDTVIDPFCGEGTALAVANSFGFDAIGVELSRRRCQSARNLRVDA
jgi:hypothetical protein